MTREQIADRIAEVAQDVGEAHEILTPLLADDSDSVAHAWKLTSTSAIVLEQIAKELRGPNYSRRRPSNER